LPKRESLLNLASFISIFPMPQLEIVSSFQLYLIHNHLFTFSLLLLELILHHNVFCNLILEYYVLFTFYLNIFILLAKTDLILLIIFHDEIFVSNLYWPFLKDGNYINLLTFVIYLKANKIDGKLIENEKCKIKLFKLPLF
jgi:hypothetical protein